jgi:predicted nucleic acid-binding protein
MGKKYLIDTNIVVFYLDNKLPKKIIDIIEDSKPSISVITRMELLSWGKATKVQSEIISKFIDASSIYTLEESVILKAIEIRRNKSMNLPDAIIAATSIVKDMVLITNDGKAFKSLKTLKRLIAKVG